MVCLDQYFIFSPNSSIFPFVPWAIACGISPILKSHSLSLKHPILKLKQAFSSSLIAFPDDVLRSVFYFQSKSSNFNCNNCFSMQSR